MTIAAALLTFLPVAVSLVLVPGVNNVVVLRETVAHGRRGGYAAIGGTSIGIITWSATVALGLGTFAAQHPRAFTWFQLLGAALLIANGLRSGLRTLRQTSPSLQSKEHSVTSQPADRADGSRRSALSIGRERSVLSIGRERSVLSIEGRSSFRSAAVTSLANPRCPVTAASVLPQFVVPGSPAAVTTLALGALWTVVAGAWNVVGVQLAHRGHGVLSRPGARRVIDGLSATALVAVGVSVAAAST